MSTAKRAADSIEDGEESTKKLKISFPGSHQNGAAAVFRDNVGFRDNSLYVKKMFDCESNSILFTRPMQLGKTTLLSLADELFSVNNNSNVHGLSYKPNDIDRNKWFVLRLDFGSVVYSPSHHDDPNDPEWVQRAKCLDRETKRALSNRIKLLLRTNPKLDSEFRKFNSNEILDQSTVTSMDSLASAVAALNGRLLILVDEYDQPVREALLRFLPQHCGNIYRSVKAHLKSSFPNYFGFFAAVKTSLEVVKGSKVWMMGITPIGISEITGLIVMPLTFDEDLADAVGLRDDDVRGMLSKVHQYAPFSDGEQERALELLKLQFNNLCFPEGSSLFHTALVNGAMNMLLSKPAARRRWLRDGNMPSSLGREPAPSSVYDVLSKAPNLRPVVNALVEGFPVVESLNEHLSLEDLLQEEIVVGDYLTLLVHIGVVSVQHEDEKQCFRLAGLSNCEDLLQPLLNLLKSSLESLVSLESTTDLYVQGESILVDFVTSISQKSMAKLMVWASADPNNNILELQFQSHVVTEAHAILNGRALATQENVLPATGKRTDVTFSSDTAVVILELKQLTTETGPSAIFLTRSHNQLAGYVKTRRDMEASSGAQRPVAGFVVIMYNDGANYCVEKLRGDI